MSPTYDSLLPLYSSMRSAGIPSVIGGSIAAMAFGEPRATLDIDIVIDAHEGDGEKIRSAYDPKRYQVPPESVLRAELSRDRDASFQILDRETGLKGDFYVAGSDELLHFGIESAREVTFGGNTVLIAPPEYIIVIKLKYYALSEQAKHLDDIRGVLRTSPGEVDPNVVSDWARRLAVDEIWERCRSGPTGE